MAHPVQTALCGVSTSSIPFSNEGATAVFYRPAEIVDHPTSAYGCSLGTKEGTNANLMLQRVHISGPEDVQYWVTILLSGGEHLAVFTSNKEIVLRKIERRNGIGDSEWVLTDVGRYTQVGSESAECFDEVFTDTICEYPFITYHDKEDARHATSL